MDPASDNASGKLSCGTTQLLDLGSYISDTSPTKLPA